LTAAVVVSSASATSLACQRSTSRRISTARCRGGRCWQGGDEGEPDAVARGDHGGGVGAGVGVDHAVGDRLQPRDLAGLDQLVAGLPAGRAETGRERPALLALEVGEADVGGDAVQPGADRRPALERVVGLPRAQVGLLDHVLGLIHEPVIR
jgi:hypothetical protein